MADIGTVWPGWHIEELLGQGSYGRVYRVSHSEHGHVSYAAAKLIEIPQDESEVSDLAGMGMDGLSIKSYYEDMAKGIVNEISLMESLKGAGNVVGIEDYRLIEREDGVGWTIWIRMELLRSLAEVYGGDASPNVSETVKIGIDICNALVCCENLGIMHRDVKPENVFESRFGDYKLGDFGIARQMGEGSKFAYSQKGTRPYMAPEIVRGEEYGAGVDVYSLGIMLYRYLNGKRFPFLPQVPQQFTADDLERAQLMRLRGDPLPAPAYADELLSGIVLKACAADVGERYASAREFRAALEAYQKGELPKPKRPERPEEPPAYKPENPKADPTRYKPETPIKHNANPGKETPEKKEKRPKKLNGALAGGLIVGLAALVVVIIVLCLNLVGGREDPDPDPNPIDHTIGRMADSSSSSSASSTSSTSSEESSSDYIFPYSGSKYLTEEDLANYSDDDLCLGMNEIWARHGRKFNNKWLQDYFDSQDWYKGTVDADDFNSEYKGSKIENANAELINEVLLDHDYDVNKAHPNG